LTLRRLLVAVVVLSFAVVGEAQAAAPGTLDPGFGSGGVVSLGTGTQLFGVAVQGDDKVLAAGQSNGSAFVERLTSTGAPDGSFGSGGVSGGPGGAARAVALQADGKVVIAGTSGGMFAERFNPNGSVDSSFGAGGIARAFGGSGIANAVGVQSDGKIVVAGSVNPIDTRIAVARFNANGSLDSSFGSGGSEVIDLGLPYEVAEGLAIQPNGKIVLVGHEQGSPTYAFFNGLVLRLNANGSLDGSFNGNGVVSWHQSGGGGSGYDTLNAVAIQNDGKIVAAGSDVGGPYAVFLRFNANGSFDTSYGSGGEAALTSGTFTSRPYGAYGVGIAGGGRIVGGGAAGLNGTDLRGALWATTAGGAPESTFGSGGVIESFSAAEICGLAVAPDGNLLVVGQKLSAASPADPCVGTNGQSAFVARFIGYGPPPPPAAGGSAPTVSTGGASSVSTTSAVLGGQVNPNGLDTSYAFQYGTTTAYGSTTPVGSAGSASDDVPVTVTLTGLSPGTKYHYRLEATNSAGTTDGQDATFTTGAAGPPGASTGSARAHEVSATIRGTVSSGGLATTYHVEFGKTTGYGSTSATANLAAASAPVNVSASITNLKPNTTYHYRLVAVNSAGTAIGADRTFKTLPTLNSKLSGVSKSYRLASALSKGISLKVSCNQACSVKASLSISASLAKTLKLGKHQTSIASRRLTGSKKGTLKVVLKFTKAAKSALSKQRGSIAALLKVTSSPIGGGQTVSFKKSLTLKP
jgi:uncharacterized delta-60 repeat protein